MIYKQSHYPLVFYAGLMAFIGSMALVGLHHVPWTWFLLSLSVYAFMAITNSAGYHRLFCHRAYQTSPFWEAFLLLSGALSCYGSSLQYCVVHTAHHQHADTEKDPHQFSSFWDVVRPNYKMDEILYSQRRAMQHLLRRPLHRLVHRFYWLFPTLMILTLLGLNPLALLYGYLVPVFIVILSAAIFNKTAHDEHGPTNSAWKALFVSGEWRHKLHHEKPHRWDLREKWYHVDCGAYLIKLIKR